MLVSIIQAVVLIAITIFIIILIRNMLQKKRNGYLEQEVEEVVERHNQLLSEVLEPYHKSTEYINLTRGKTKERYEELSEEFFSILNTTKEAQQNLEGLRVTRESYGSVVAVLPRAKQQVKDEFERLQEANQKLLTLNQEDKEMSSQLKKEKEKLKRLSHQLTSLQEDTGYSLRNLMQKLKHITYECEEISGQLEQLDFIAATDELNQLEEDIKELTERTSRIEKLLKKEKELELYFEGGQSEQVTEMFHKFKAALEAGEVDRATHFMQEADQNRKS